MIKEDIITAVANDTGYRRTAVSDIVESTINNITSALSRGERVQFSGFGTFEPKKRAARTGRNPHTGEKVAIPARIMPVFTAGKCLKNSVSKEVK